MKILIVVATLSHGGAERAAANISLGLSGRHDVVVFVFHGNISYPYGGKLIDCGFPYNPQSSLVKKPWLLYQKSRAFRQALSLEKPDVVLSFAEGPNLVALLNRDYDRQYLINSQIPPSFVYNGLNRIIYKTLIRKTYGRTDLAIAVSEGVKVDLQENFAVPAEKLRVIYNPVDCEQIRSDAEEEVTEPVFECGIPVILNVGRLAPQKNQALLIRAFARVRRHFSAKLVFIGQGSLESELRSLSAGLGVEQDVHFLGWRSNPFKYMRRAGLFALSSDYEGIGSVILEAMVCGSLVISTDCPYGPGEIIENNKNGLLVPVGNEEGLAEAISTALADENLCRRLSAAGEQRARDFDLPIIARQYEELFGIVKDSTGNEA